MPAAAVPLRRQYSERIPARVAFGSIIAETPEPVVASAVPVGTATVVPAATAPVTSVPRGGVSSAAGGNLLFGSGGVADPLAPIVTPLGWAGLAVSRRDRADAVRTVAPAAAVTTSAPSAASPPAAPAISAAIAPTAAALVQGNPIATFANQVRSFVNQIVSSVSHVIRQVVTQVKAVINQIVGLLLPTGIGNHVEVPTMVVTTLQYKNVAGVDPNYLSMDVYSDPAFVTGGLAERPVMIYIHGGGLKNGDRLDAASYVAKAPHFVSNDYVYVSLNYRLSPSVVSPSHIEDVADAVMYVHDNIAQYGGDPDQIYVMGHSAGAYLASLLATNEKYIEGAGGDLSMIKAVVSLDTWTYLSVAGWQQEELSEDPAERFDAVPANHVDGGKAIPPFLIFYRDHRSQAAVAQDQTAFVELLQDNGIPGAAVRGLGDDHIALNREIGTIGDQKTAIIMEFLADPTQVTSIAARYGFTAE